MTKLPERLVAVLYILMRDELPVGTIPKILRDFDENTVSFQGDSSLRFTNKHLEAYARDLAERILEE